MSFKHPTERALIYKQKGSNNWYISYYNHLNQRKQITAKTDNLELAKKKLEEILLVQKLIKDGTINPFETGTTKTVDFCCFKTIQELQAEKPQKSVYSAYIRHLKLIGETFKGLSIRELDKLKLKELFRDPLSETQLRVRKTALKHMFEYAMDGRYIDQKPEIPDGKIKGQEIFRESITEEQYNFLIQRFRLKSLSENDERKRLNAELLCKMIMVLYKTGMRLGEAANLRHEDIKLVYEQANDTYKLFIDIKKSKTTRRTILGDSDLIDIMYIPEEKDKNKFIFGIDNKVVDFSGILQRDREYNLELYKANGLDNFVIYELRHSFITRKIREKKSLIYLAQHCGTSVKMIEKHYLDHIVAENYENIYNFNESANYITHIQNRDKLKLEWD